MMRFMQWLHRWVSLILVVQVLLWLSSGLFFAFTGHHGMSGHQYLEHQHPAMLTDTETTVGIETVYANYPQAKSIELASVMGVGQYIVTLADKTLYLDATSGQVWRTDATLAQEIALASYSGPGSFESIAAVTGSDEVVGWDAKGFRVDMADDLNTRIYVDAASGQVVEHRNTPWTIADWAFKLHFMDYSGERSFNHLLIWSAGLLALWFSLSGLILLGRNIAQGDFNPRRKPTLLEHLQNTQQPVASSCGGGGTCGLCKVTLHGDQLPQPTAAEKAMLSPAEIKAGLRLSCQHRVNDSVKVELPNNDVATVELTLAAKRQLTPSIVELTFSSERAIDYAAGQFLQFRIPHQEQVLTRHYSVATRPNPQQLVFTVRQMPSPSEGVPPGIGSSYLCQLAIADTIEAIGPFGDFLLTDANARTQLFIGGGAGIAPLRALLQTEQTAESPRDCVFFYGARHRSELCYRDEFEQHTGINYTPVLSEASAEEQWQGETGFVHQVVEKWLQSQNAANLDIYVCGPPPMLKATMAMLAAAKVPRDQIRFDDFGI
ncbi:Na(+)-translocating NADH-quinone reductase subunit F [Pseudidiomarina piscicola]|uniref:Na(+)-translocating NADH-quinone reductase subunit F n=1 Tax=Pseudidiomarina piscicola TaxID=2614830 RepID=A0A6S6WVN4_9GAMM|nr:FAD-binding oxidoreductase [Pseudidiomarina piscicola]CAB0151720.1 Na(+)-translocating NADH-quinone reductase subunit F [Pseudidiomarina piscicola]VZT41177.1 Na(+)-translocating NADH-quinone reductase subunit F [Pseudomonas aeruginosa]